MPLESFTRDINVLRKQLAWGYVVVVCCFLAVVVKLVVMQAARGEEYRQKSEINIVRVQDVPTFRGIIRDDKGRILAGNRPAYQVYVTPAFVDYEKDFPAVCDYLGLSQGEREALLAKVKDQKGLKAYQPFLVNGDITRDQLALFATHLRTMRGVRVTYEPKRVYPLGHVAAHAIGYLATVRREDLKAHPDAGYKANDKIGRFGIEKAFEHVLRGRRGWKKIVVNSKGVILDASEMRRLVPGPFQKDPVPGQDLVTSLDVDLMKHIDRLFRGHPSGSAVVMDIHSGRVVALYSKPSYDPNDISAGMARGKLAEMNESPFHPWMDRTVGAAFAPGSTFKIITALSALEEGIITPRDNIVCNGFMEISGRTYRCTGQHGKVDLHSAIVYSCNVFFYNLALMVGMDRISKYAMLLNMGAPTGIGINAEVGGFVPTRDWYMNKMKMPFMPGYTVNMSIGQGNLQATPLQMALAFSAIANGGALYKPTLLKRIERADGTPVQRFFPELVRAIPLREESFNELRDAMVGVLDDPQGTAHGLNTSDIAIAGKTGTAQVPLHRRKKGEKVRDYWYFTRDHAWFVAFAPAGTPEVVAVVMVEHGGIGGKIAAPIAVNTLVSYLKESY